MIIACNVPLVINSVLIGNSALCPLLIKQIIAPFSLKVMDIVISVLKGTIVIKENAYKYKIIPLNSVQKLIQMVIA